ncbi:two-component system chemotaxis response regulator CheY [Desulfobotulus alkaliphilus]|uniref:Two-component system chemotaxis response regulator CheY n=1 Tax=Desulfobotulus alkaliphilus TaxID=622671 RepID=A0A562RJI2_9BACT|nr:response regulator [Desulfobotulus alkaliphilus]TWI68500.1 two-component system chemotaxis response regulator CheY [Desulfobotulus alkaliphilus]
MTQKKWQAPLNKIDADINILVADDEQIMRQILGNILKTLGLTKISYASDGGAAWLRLQIKPAIDLILLDWNMPKMTGPELLSMMRKSEDYKNIPVLMITAEGTREHILKAMEIGATNYVVKPFTPAVIEKKIRQILQETEESG